MNHNSARISQSGRTCKAYHFTIYRWDCVEVPVGTGSGVPSSDKVLCVSSVHIVTRLWHGWGFVAGRE
jgi:hypothetical protein